jgi:SAM-dependent methyltransferase
VLFPLARLVGPSGQVTGIDLSPKMVAATAADAEAAGLDLTVRVGDAQDPGVEPESLDLVTSSLVLFFLPDPAAALRAWRDALRAGGRVGVSTFGKLSDSWHDVDAVFAPYLPPGMADPRTTATDSPFASDAGVEGLLTDAGFTAVRTVSETVEVRFTDEAQWHDWTWSVGQRRMWLQVPEAERPAVRALAAERLQLTRDADGRIGFDQVVRYTLGER